ncbi:DUF6249 domain-containing protein [Phenylobacterium sp.]|uniref:DUF6249 domain-containing protein n=1 Tax=Phenylobacterium sp. TaxID=1871053 RepID=UPI0039831242
MEILIPITMFAMIAAIVIAPRYFKSQERMKMAETLRAAIDKGQPLPLEMIEAMSSDTRVAAAAASPQRDLRTGIIWTGVGVGLASLGLAMSFEEPDMTYPLLGLAAFPIFIGLAFILISFLNKSRD